MGGWGDGEGGVGADLCVRPGGGMGKMGEFWILDCSFFVLPFSFFVFRYLPP